MRLNSSITKLVIISISLVVLAGCASLVAKKPGDVLILPEDRIFTFAKGTPITVLHDGKPVTITFPEDMQLVSSTVLARNEMLLNQEALKAAKAEKDASKKVTLWGSIFGVLAAGMGLFASFKKWKPSLNLSVK